MYEVLEGELAVLLPTGTDKLCIWLQLPSNLPKGSRRVLLSVPSHMKVGVVDLHAV